MKIGMTKTIKLNCGHHHQDPEGEQLMTTKWPSCKPPKGKIMSEDHVLKYWDYYVTVTMAENEIFMKEVGKQTFHDIERAKAIGKKGGQGHHTKGKYFEAAKKRQPRTPTYNRYVYNG